MAQFKVFVSSTCYDLNIVRSELRSYLKILGHEPIMSEYNDLLFDPREHTHESCIKEIGNADAVILIIGSRYGGTAIPNAVNTLDIEKLKTLSKSTKSLDRTDKISITQLEIFKAIESNIPIFTFIDSRVMHDHLFYERNKDKDILDKLDFPSIDKKESAIYIFEFINFIRLRSNNNSIIEFTTLAEIEDYLKRQWSALLQRLLYEQRIIKSETRRLESFSEELKDIKSLILSSISTGQAKEVGRGVLKYRRLIEFFFLIDGTVAPQILIKEIQWESLITEFDIKEIIEIDLNGNSYRPSVYLIKNDGTFFESRYMPGVIKKLSIDWSNFKQLEPAIKQDIIFAIAENSGNEFLGRVLRFRDIQFDVFVKEQNFKRNSNDSNTKNDTELFEKFVLLESDEDEK